MKKNAEPPNQFYFRLSEMKRFRHLGERQQQLNSYAGALLHRAGSVWNTGQSRELAISMEAVARQLVSIQKRYYEMLASAQEPPYRLLVCECGRRCATCRNLPRRNPAGGIVELAAAEVCRPRPEIDILLDVADIIEERIIFCFNSRPRFGTTTLARALSALKSALFRQKSRLPKFRRSSFDPEPEIVAFAYTYHCTYCLKQLPCEYEIEHPPNARLLEALRIRKLPRERRCIAGLREPFEIVLRISGPEDGLVRREDIRRIRAFRRTAQAKREPEYSTRVSVEEGKSDVQEEA